MVDTPSLIVTTSADIVADDGETSLREAIAFANSNADASNITFAAGLLGQQITLAGSELVLSSEVTIDGDINGDDVADITVSGDDASRVFNVAGGAATLDALTITNGYANAGGGVFVGSGATLDLANSTVSGNSAYISGGGLYNSGTSTLTNSTISGNSADLSGGGLSNFGTATLTNTTISGNSAYGYGGGGGLYIGGKTTATLSNSIVLGNDANSNAEVAGSVTSITSLTSGVASDVFAALDSSGGGLLTDNGGSVQTIALKADALNPTIDAGTDASAPLTDARGLGRVDLNFINNGGTADLGAFEIQDQFLFAPTITSGSALSAAENQTIAGVVVATDDKPGLVFSITGGVDAALFTIDGSNGTLLFKSAPNFEVPGDAGGDNVHDIVVTVTDSGGLMAVQSATVTVTDVNEAPVAAASFATGDEDTVISGALTASDVDGNALSFSVVNGPSNGSVTVNANGSFQFTPVADFNGTDSFTFNVSDGSLSDTSTATITVNPVDEPAPVDPVDPVDPTGPTPFDDILLGTALNDTINALAGNDNVNGLAGDDLLIGGGGDDRLRGKGGDDTLKGGGGDDNIKGGVGADLIRGNGGADIIKAGGGADNVNGGGGADKISGGGGADVLNGGGGADTLRGNGGADVFQFRTSDRNDTIVDFRQGQDKIEIQNGANSFAALDIEQDGRDVLIGFGTGQVRVVTDSIDAFDESDFIF